MNLPATRYPVRPAVPYVPDLFRGFWVAYVDDVGFPVCGFGRSSDAAVWDATMNAIMLEDDDYREARRTWQPKDLGDPAPEWKSRRA